MAKYQTIPTFYVYSTFAHIFPYVSRLWNHLHSRWTDRNTFVHGQTANPEQQRLDSQIRALYSLSSKLPSTFRCWPDTPLDQLLSSPLDYKRAWITNTAPVVQQGLRIATRLLHHRQRPITDFFQPISRPAQAPNTSEDPLRQDNGPIAPD